MRHLRFYALVVLAGLALGTGVYFAFLAPREPDYGPPPKGAPCCGFGRSGG